MKSQLLYEYIIPAQHGKGFKIKSGQTMRMIAIEGPQVADIAFFNAHNYSETYDAMNSYMYNCRLGTGSNHTQRYLFSRLPQANVLVELTDDKVGRHWAIAGGHCSWKTNDLRGRSTSLRTCHENLAEAIRDYGLTKYQVPNSFPLWMNVEDNTGGDYIINPPLAKKGDYCDFLAHMDLLVAISACPGQGAVNAYKPKALKAEIWSSQ